MTLKKRGKTYVGLCPFHSEKTPSFSVEPVKAFYHCFGCGVGGNVFTFLMEMEKISFPEAMRLLANRANIDLPEYHQDDSQEKEAEGLYHVNQFALQFYQNCLEHKPIGQKARTYLEKRGFNQETISEFKIGYAPDLWDGLLKKAAQSSVSKNVLRSAGLIIPRNDDKGFYDRFRERIMFPIFNPSGHVVGFGGRTLNERKNVPKYINSPETLIYRKSQLLYGLFQSKTEIQKKKYALIVEGYTDLMRCHQYGFRNVVATSGTALTEGQVRLLLRFTKEVVLIYDGDSAGIDAARRGADILLEVGLHIKIIMLPKGSDPDSYIRENGSQGLMRLLKSPQTVVDFHLDFFKDQNSEEWDSPHKRAEAARAILASIYRIRDPIEKNLMIKDLAEKLMLDEDLLHQYSVNLNQGGGRGRTQVERENSQVNNAREIAEKGLIILLLDRYDRVASILFKYIDADHFTKRENRIIFEGLYDTFLQGKTLDINRVLDRFQSDEKIIHYLTMLMAEGLEPNIDWSKFGLDCLLLMKEAKIQEKIDRVRQNMKSAQKQGVDPSRYGREWISLKNMIKDLHLDITSEWKKNVEI